MGEHPRINNVTCKCQPCRDIRAARAKQYRRDRAKEAYGFDRDGKVVSSWPARKALRRAQIAGVSFVEMERATGLARCTFAELIAGNRKRIKRSTERTILNIYGGSTIPRHYSPGQLVSMDNYRWKVRALFAQGWTIDLIRDYCEQAGQPYKWMNRSLLKEEIQHVQYDTSKIIDWLVQDIGDRHGPSTINKKRMARRGSFPLIHYTEDGKLIHASLTDEQKRLWRRVQ